MTTAERLPRAWRLAQASELRRCLARGRRRRTGHLEMIWADNTLGHPRLGLVVPRFQQTAVARNRLRRRLKEIWRRDIAPAAPAWDVVVRTRREAYAASFADLRGELLGWRDQTAPRPARS